MPSGRHGPARAPSMRATRCARSSTRWRQLAQLPAQVAEFGPQGQQQGDQDGQEGHPDAGNGDRFGAHGATATAVTLRMVGPIC